VINHLLRHHAERAARGVAYNAISHCHVKGLHSVMLHDEPENRIRMFYASYDHELHHNLHLGTEQSLAIHAHHCDVRFIGIHGSVTNRVFKVLAAPEGSLHEMEYVSAITSGGPGSLTPTGVKGVGIWVRNENINTNPALRAEELHTIWVPKGETASWLVIEGQEDPDYDPRCWTQNPKPSLEGLYQPMTQVTVANILYQAIRCHDLTAVK
jgi:hypothetical protein